MNKRNLLAVALLFCLATPLLASIPSGYYTSASGKYGAALKTALASIITSGHDAQSYAGVWTAYKTTDLRSDGYIWDRYSSITNYTYGYQGGQGNACGNYTAEGSCYNREHSWPKSWFGCSSPSAGTPASTDLHQVVPTDGYVNNTRQAYIFGEVKTASKTYSNAKFGTGGYGSYQSYTVFEPADEYKGDFARIYFYMVTRYQTNLSSWYSSYSSTDVSKVIDGSTYPAFQTWYLEMLLAWAKADPVDSRETARNDAVYAIQANRNPFIDFPGLEDYIWGDHKTTNVDLTNYTDPYSGSGSTTVSAPTISPNGGSNTIGTNVSVTLSCSTSGATIYYTTNGSTPTSSSTAYSSAFNVTSASAGTITVKAIAIKDGTSSSVTSASFVFSESGSSGGDGTTFTKVTSTSQLVSGSKYILVNADAAVAAGTTYTSTSNAGYLNSTSVTISGNDVTIDSNVAVFTLGVSGSNYSLYNSDLGGYLTATAAKKLSFSTSQVYVWTASAGSNNGYQIAHTSSYGTMYYNSSTPRFTTYTSAQAEADLYVEKTTSTTVNAPTFSPAAGTYTAAQTVTISSTTSGATIRYTTDGTTPTATTGTTLSNGGTVSISESCTLKAVAVLSGTASSVTSGTYTINIPQVATPTFSPAAGTYTAAQSVTISCSTSGATIYYTTDGTTPTTSSSVYSSAIAVSSSMTIKAIAVKSGMTNSEVASAAYTINESGGGGSSSSDDEYELITSTSDLEAGAKYLLVANYSDTYYAYTGVSSNWGTTVTVTPSSNVINLGTDTNGSSVAPLTLGGSSGAWTFYDATNSYYLALTSSSNALHTAENTTANTAKWAISVSSNLFQIQNVGTSGYYIRFNTSTSNLKFRCYSSSTGVFVQLYKQKASTSSAVETPTFSPAAGTYTSAQSVTISSTTSGATIYYTTDGSTPTTSSSVYSSAISVSSTATIKALAVKSGMTNSEVATATYTINIPQVETPTFSPAGGTYTSAQSVTISCATDGATIYYTTNGDTPTTASSVYSTAIPVSATTTIKAIAVLSGYTNSEVASATYTISASTSTTSARYVKITSTDELVSGEKYLIVYESGPNAFDGSLSNLDVTANYISVTINTDKTPNYITATDAIDASSFTITEGSSNYNIKSASGYWIGKTSDSNGMDKNNESTGYANSISFDSSGNVNIVGSGGAYLRFNSATGTTNNRYRYYRSSSYTNQKAIQLYKRVEYITSTISAAQYGTMYYGDLNLIVPTNVTAYTYKINDSGKPERSKTYAAESIIPAGEAVVIYSATPATYEFFVTSTTADPDGNSDMSGSNEAATTTGGAKYYKLSLNAAQDAGTLGWYWGASGGAAFTNGAHKAYLVVPNNKASLVQANGFAFADETTGIVGLETSTDNGLDNAAIYTLDGRRVKNGNLQRGVYIVNGKKVVIK